MGECLQSAKTVSVMRMEENVDGVSTKKHSAAPLSFAFCKWPKTMALESDIPDKNTASKKTTSYKVVSIAR